MPPRKSSYALLKALGVTLIGFGIGIGYSHYNPEFRAQIEASIPYADKLFARIDSITNKEEPKSLSKQDILPFESVLQKHEKIPVVKNDLILEEESLKPIIPLEPEPVKETIIESVNEPLKLEKQPEIEVKLENVEVPEPSVDWKQTLKEHELKEEAAIKAIEEKLRGNLNEVVSRVSESIKSSEKSIDSLKSYSIALKEALEDPNEESNVDSNWKRVTETFESQLKDVRETNERIEMAKRAIVDLDRLLGEIKSSNLTQYLSGIREIQLELIKQFNTLQNERQRLSEAVVHANVLRAYTNEQKTARDQFLKEIQSLQPEGITHHGKTADETLTNEELNNLLIHAHKRVLQLQKQLAKMQQLENKHVQQALEEQKRQFEEMEKDNLTNQVELTKREFEVEKEKLAEVIKNRLQEDLKKELSRQAAAHNNHLAEMLKLQEKELESLYEKKLLLELERIKRDSYNQVADSFGRLRGIEQTLLARAKAEEEIEKSKKLWLAIENLNKLLVTRGTSELNQVRSTVETIKALAPQNEFVNEILMTLSPTIIERGICPENDLKERYAQLKDTCKKVALVDDRGASLVKYAISYLQSFFILNTTRAQDATRELELTEKQLNTFNLLNYAERFIEQGDFEMAIRLLQQLKGEPKRLAKDWINEALLLLEVKQACNLLTAYISSLYLSTSIQPTQ